MSSNHEHQVNTVPTVSNKGHHALLKQACSLVGRDYNVVVSFNSYKEEYFTIQCALAIIVVCTLALGTSYTAIDYILFDYIKPTIPDKPFELVEKWKIVIPAFFAFVIYVIDMSILNSHKSIENKGSEDSISIFYFLKVGIFKIIFSKPALTFRVLLIASSAILSSLFLIAKINEQLMASAAYNTMLSTQHKAKEHANDNAGSILKENLSVQEQKKSLSDELLRLKSALRKADVDKDRELASIKANYEKQELSERERLDLCINNCQTSQQKIDNLARRKRADINEAKTRYRNEQNEIKTSISDVTDRLKNLTKEYAENNTRVELEKSSYNIYKEELSKETDKYIDMQKSFGALIRYMKDGDPSGRGISMFIFAILLIFFSVIDSLVLLLKFSHDSLYDRYQDEVHETRAHEIDTRGRINKYQIDENASKIFSCP